MAGLENLFATDPQLPQTQTKKLPQDSAKWSEELTNEVRELYPDTARLLLTVEFKKQDEQSGTAMGAIHVKSGESEKAIAVPFVIRRFELSPLDVWMEMETQAVHPITTDTFKEQFFIRAMAGGLDARPQDAAGSYFNDPSLWTTNYPPLQGRYSYASAGYPLCDAISDTLSEADIIKFRRNLEKNASMLMKFQKHGHLELIQKIAKKHGVPSSNDFKATAEKLIPRSAHSIKKNGPDSYSILSIADKLFDLTASESPMSRKDCLEWTSKITAKPQDVMLELDQEGERMCIMPRAPKKGVFLFDDVRDKPVEAKEFAAYYVKTKNGVGIEGVVIPHVVNFDGKRAGVKLFLSPGHSSMQDSIAGLHKPQSMAVSTCLRPGAARVGQTGTFVYIDDGKAIATVPVTIKAVEEYGPLTAVTLDGRKIKISRGYTSYGADRAKTPKGSKAKVLDVHGMIEQHPSEYVIPHKMAWIPMEGFEDVSHTPNEWIQKEASAHMTAQQLKIDYTGSEFVVEGLGLAKQAMPERHMKLLLATCGAELDKIAQIVKQAKTKRRAIVYGLNVLKKKADIIKEASQYQESWSRLCESFKTDDLILKVAAEFDDQATVDALLGLNFINPDNIGKFVSYRPVFEKIQDYLAELTIASRLGMKDVPESATVIAMHKLREISEGLHKMESALKKGMSGGSSKLAKAMSRKDPYADPEMDPAGSTGKPMGEGEDEVEKVNHFSNGMADIELGTHMYLDKARVSPAAMMAYMNGRRMGEQSKAMSAMQMGMQPPNGMKVQKPQQPAGQGKKK